MNEKKIDHVHRFEYVRTIDMREIDIPQKALFVILYRCSICGFEKIEEEIGYV